MALSRTRARSSRPSRLKSATLAVRCRINSIPVKAMLYALSYAIAKAESGRGKATATEVGSAKRAAKGLGSVAVKLGESIDIDPEEMHDMLNGACSSFINLYYSLGEGVKRSILEEHRKGKRDTAFEKSMLTFPVIASMRSEPKSEVILAIRKSLYKKPFLFLHSAISSSRKIESLRVAMALNESKVDGMKRLSYSLMSVERRLGSIDRGIMNPMRDEAFKADLINGIAMLSEQSDIHTLSYIDGKLDERTFNIKSAQRVIRE